MVVDVLVVVQAIVQLESGDESSVSTTIKAGLKPKDDI